MVFENFYLEDFPNFTDLAAELDHWYYFWNEIKHKTDLPDSTSATLKRVDALAFTNLYLVLKLLGPLPITPDKCERSFPSLRSIKTWNKSPMANGRLNGLALLLTHREIDLTVSEIIDSFAQKSRRIQLKQYLPRNNHKLASKIYVASEND